ncbi:hypothetical protein MYP_643 [Sporocytophaga myxococcoides]|uniref:Uncharacterized protein n=1 Tax=Sporocytophaga myxococcoides TaxID=153721 RepID=A0A098L956_9BACT|nr:hypothetical protein [Sporocytophaga myxococcoides]GAL83416.1 hypothetical protein MYP_643 [Sporocytophaga myxococcoides]
MNDFLNSVQKDGIKVVVDIPNSFFYKLGAVIVASVVLSAIGFFISKSLFNK